MPLPLKLRPTRTTERARSPISPLIFAAGFLRKGEVEQDVGGCVISATHRRNNQLSISLKGFKKVQTSLVEGMNANVGRQLVLRKFKVKTHVAVAPAAEASRRDGSAALRAIFMRVGKPLASSRLRTILSMAALRVHRTPRPLGGLRSTLRGTCPRPNMIRRPTM